MTGALLDTDVLIQAWRKHASIPSILDERITVISTISYIEFLQGVNHRQKSDAREMLSKYEHVRLNSSICEKAVELIDIHSHTDGLRLADSLIAATAIVLNLELLSLNRRHFQNIADLKLI